MSTKKLKNYSKKGYRRVDGWLIPVAMRAIIEIANVQQEKSIEGPVCEIGVHHGRLFILLHLLTRKSEKSVAWDLFDNQDENEGKSGMGNRTILNSNLEKHDCDLERIVIKTKNSLELTPEEILKDCDGRPRLFSIDGGHSAEITQNDLALAADTVCEGGVIILDDFFNEAWPGVAEGTCRYIIKNPGLYPVAIVGNKVMLTNVKSAADSYVSNLSFSFTGYISKKTTFFDQPVVCYRPLKTNVIWKHLRDRPIGHFLKRVVKRK